ncbi:MAG: glucose 1-dehydrogenase [Alphaproteobacteria bacterium]|nr:glucose 1-dehydrogenase [Alphaproteobacteria bacterium]
MSSRLAGKVALVTGGASGLGQATARLFVAEGARVAVTDIDEPAGAAVAKSLGPSATFIRHDVTSEADWQAAIEATVAAFGGLHILVNSAGIGPFGNIEETSFADWRRVHAVDLDGVFLGCKWALPAMARTCAGDGRKAAIVNISSVAGIIAGHNLVAYNSAKAGVRHLTKSVALHCARQGYPIRCNSVHPAFIDTPILDIHRARFGNERALEKLGRQIPMGRVGQPEEVAYGILYLASDEASFTTASELVIDGGITAM